MRALVSRLQPPSTQAIVQQTEYRFTLDFTGLRLGLEPIEAALFTRRLGVVANNPGLR